MFLCRDTELRKLNARYQKNAMECIVIYGRRRVGKTALIQEFTKDKPTIHFPALDSGSGDNLRALSKAIGEYKDPQSASTPVFESYDDAFAEITRLAEKERMVFVIDEYPYLAKSEKSISSRLQHLLDGAWSGSRLFFILCGSSMSFMEKEVLSQKSPLFGRRTAQFKLEALDYRDTARFYPDFAPEQNALLYGITGGIPHYINKLDVKEDMAEALLANFFDPSSYLFEEPENLLKQELREPAVYNSVITAIAEGAAKLNDIATKVGINTASCTKYLKGLMELGIVSKITPMTEKAGKKTLYRICDNFFRFWYRFVPRNMTAIHSGRMEAVFPMAVESFFPDYMGLVFETICRQYLIYYAKDLPFVIGEIGEWWGNHPRLKREIQLDIVAADIRQDNQRQGNQYIIGSCKYRSEPVGTDELELIRDYASVFTTVHDTCHYYIFSKSGFTEGLCERENAGEVRLVELEELY